MLHLQDATPQSPSPLPEVNAAACVGSPVSSIADPPDRPAPGVLEAMGEASPTAAPTARDSWPSRASAWSTAGCRSSTSPAADQPLGNEDGSIQVVFNGEIYNYQDLTRRAGSRAATASGPAATPRSSSTSTRSRASAWSSSGSAGMFAFAIWDRPRRRLLLARDRLGIKPLYLYRDAEKLLFGSEIEGDPRPPGVCAER